MDGSIAYVIFGGIFLLIGFAGTIVPVLPGAPLAWLGLLLAYFSVYTDISVTTLIITAVIAVLVSILDNIFPIIFTKQSGGSKAGTWGSTIGLIVGFFIGPIGIIAGPFIGAWVGEMIHDNSDSKRALSAAFGSLKGFLLGTGMKMIACGIFIWIFVTSLVNPAV
jgi:uncharacterized protein YqgC (DUF456 family)